MSALGTKVPDRPRLVGQLDLRRCGNCRVAFDSKHEPEIHIVGRVTAKGAIKLGRAWCRDCMHGTGPPRARR